MIDDFIEGLGYGFVTVLCVVAWHRWVLRQRHGRPGAPLPAWLIRTETPSYTLREIIAKVARSEAKDAVQEWSTLPPGLQKAIRREINAMVAQGFAAHDRRGNTK